MIKKLAIVGSSRCSFVVYYRALLFRNDEEEKKQKKQGLLGKECYHR